MKSSPLILLLALTLPACSLAPPETKQEKVDLAQAGKPYVLPAEKRILPALPSDPTAQDILTRAFLGNGDLESAYFEWQAAVQRIDMAAAYPNSNVQVGYSYMFSGGQAKAWDRSTVSVGFDPSMNLKLPQKVQQAGKVALDQAQAAGDRFRTAKFTLQKKVLTAWYDYAFAAEEARIHYENVQLLKIVTTLAADRVSAGAPQQDLQKAQIEYRLAENEHASMLAEIERMHAMLNGMLARPADAPLAAPKTLPAPRPIPDDAALLALGVDRNPELAALSREVAGRTDALKLAKLAYIPDINPNFSFTGSAVQVAGAMAMLPTTIPMIEGQIKEARAMMQSSEAMLRQTRSERAASYVATLVALRNAERQSELFEKAILPRTRQVWSASRQSYMAGQVPFAEIIDAQRLLLEVRRLTADSRIQREKFLVDLETLAATDIESLNKPAATSPATTAPATTTTTEAATTRKLIIEN